MKRREFITLLGGAAAAWPLGAGAQQPGRTYRLGFFLPVARDSPAIIAFFDELRIHGFIEGQNLAIIPGGFQAGNEQVDELVPTLVKAGPDAIIAGGDVIPRALQNATRTIPIVVITEDMVAAGFAASLAHPGGNITGISLMSPELDGKRQDILIEAVPSAPRIAVLADSNVATLRHLQALEEAARAHRKELLVVRDTATEILRTDHQKVWVECAAYRRLRKYGTGIPRPLPVSGDGDQPLCAKCRHFAAFRARPDSVCVRLGLAGWGGRIRTSASESKCAVRPLAVATPSCQLR
jgi:hypothetical protein